MRIGFDAVIGGADLAATFRPAFARAVDAGALGVMCSCVINCGGDGGARTVCALETTFESHHTRPPLKQIS